MHYKVKRGLLHHGQAEKIQENETKSLNDINWNNFDRIEHQYQNRHKALEHEQIVSKQQPSKVVEKQPIIVANSRKTTVVHDTRVVSDEQISKAKQQQNQQINKYERQNNETADNELLLLYSVINNVNNY